MHVITRPVHVIPCSNLAMKGNKGTNRILYHDIVAQTTTEPTTPLRVSLFEPGIPDWRLPWVFFKRKHIPDAGNSVKDDSSDHFRLSDVQRFRLWHYRLRVWVLLSVIRGLAIAVLPWMLDLWSSRRAVFVETRSSRWIFSSAAVVWFFETVLLNVRRSLSVSAEFRALFLFVYVHITSETVALDTAKYYGSFRHKCSS
jgi:hypothetical protein